MTTFEDDPLHELAAGITLYVTDSLLYPELSRDWEIMFPVPSEYPYTFGELALAVQLNEQPVTCE